MAIIPTVEFIKFDTAVDPSGFRHIAASGQILGTSASNCLDFGNSNVTTSGVISDTSMLIFRASNLGDASGVYNLRLFLSSASAFNVGNYRFLWRVATHYQGPDFGLSLADLNIPVSEPTSQNILATNEQPVLSGITDADVSQYIYLAVFTDIDVPFGTYGACGAGSFRYRLLYEFN